MTLTLECCWNGHVCVLESVIPKIVRETNYVGLLKVSGFYKNFSKFSKFQGRFTINMMKSQ